MQKLYQIRHKDLNLFSKGGMDCHHIDNDYCVKNSWSKNGKVWTTVGALRRHLQQYEDDTLRTYRKPIAIPDEWEVVEITINDDGTCFSNTYNAKKFYFKTHLN